MDMPGPPASSLEATLCQCVEELSRRKLIQGAATEPASMLFTLENPNRNNEASPNLHHERGLKCNAPRVSNEKMGPRQGAVSKQRQQRQTTKGTTKVYPADQSNFRALVHEHTSKLPSSPPPDVTAQPSSPLTPHSIASTSSARGFMAQPLSPLTPHSITSTSSAPGFMSQPSSPTTPHSIQSSSTSPLSSPHQGHPNGGPYLSPFSLPFKAHTEHSRHKKHLNLPYPRPLLWNANQNNCNTNLHQTNYVPRSASTPCLGISSEANNVPFNDGRPHGMSRSSSEANSLPFNDSRPHGMSGGIPSEANNVPFNDGQPHGMSRGIPSEANNIPFIDGEPHGMSPATYAKVLSFRSLARFLLDDDTVCNSNCM